MVTLRERRPRAYEYLVSFLYLMTTASLRATEDELRAAMKKKKPVAEEHTGRIQKGADVFALPDGHHMGARYGFEKVGDQLHLAPIHTNLMDDIRVDQGALDDYIEAVSRHLHIELQKLRRRRQEWWKAVEEDLGIKREDVTYFFAGYLKRIESAKTVAAVDPHADSEGTPTPRV